MEKLWERRVTVTLKCIIIGWSSCCLCWKDLVRLYAVATCSYQKCAMAALLFFSPCRSLTLTLVHISWVKVSFKPGQSTKGEFPNSSFDFSLPLCNLNSDCCHCTYRSSRGTSSKSLVDKTNRASLWNKVFWQMAVYVYWWPLVTSASKVMVAGMGKGGGSL